MRVGGIGVIHFGGCNETLLLRPALVDALETPFGAAPGGADRLIVHDDEDRVRVGRRQDAHGNPTAALDGDVVEGDVAKGTVGGDLLLRDGIAVDDQFHVYVARVTDAGALQVPVGGLVVGQG